MTGENGEPDLQNIEDDEEYEAVADAFDEILDAAEFDELVEEEEDSSTPSAYLLRDASQLC